MASPDIKICGINSMAALGAALEAGADYVGLVFYPPSPRALELDAAAELAEAARGRTRIVALTVDADDALIDGIMETVRPDVLQLHGGEAPEAASQLRARTGAHVMKALRIATRDDLASLGEWQEAADTILFDARPPKGVGLGLPGGNGVTFDWRLLQDVTLDRPYMLSGGLDAANVAQALTITRAPAIDVSSGVETAPGRKDPALIRAFVAAVRAATQQDSDKGRAA